MNSIQTNRDFYLAIAELTKRESAEARELEEYLRALWNGALGFRTQVSLSVDEFVELLSAAFTLPAPPFDEAWRSRYADDDAHPLAACLAAKLKATQAWETKEAGASDFDRWEAFVLRQIVDLREMAEQGMLEDEQRYFGIDSPRGQRWYNFDPCTFLECATAGSFGGWEAGDDTGRHSLTDSVAEPEPVVAMCKVSWNEFQSFLGCGQWYE